MDESDDPAPLERFAAHLNALEVLVLELVRIAERDEPGRFDRLKVEAISPDRADLAERINQHLAILLRRSRSAARPS